MDRKDKARTQFNTNATPFYPSLSPKTPAAGSGSQAARRAAQGPQAAPPMPLNPYILVNFSNIPYSASKADLHDLIEAELDGVYFNITNFQKAKFSDNDQEFQLCSCMVETYDAESGMALVDAFNGYEWESNTLSVKLFNPYYFNPYYFMPPPGVMPPPVPFSGPHLPPPALSRSHAISSASVASSPGQSRKASTSVPQFLMSLVNRPVDNMSSSPSEEFIIIKNDEGQAIKVNPCRLFIGNIPFSSTWPTLKAFLVNRSKELDPDNTIEITRVEIPMHTHYSYSGLNKLNSYQFLSSFAKESPREDPSETDDSAAAVSSTTPPAGRGLSRGFAIVTTGNKQSSDKLIEYFDGAEFEGRNLTVRYDKFPDFNNYILQQLYPTNVKEHKMASNSGLERHNYQNRMYYGRHSMAGGVPNNQFPIPQPNFIPQIHPSAHYTNNLIPRSMRKKPAAKISDDTMDEDEKARELVNSFKSLGISS